MRLFWIKVQNMMKFGFPKRGLAIIIAATIAACGGDGGSDATGAAGPGAAEVAPVATVANPGFVSPGKPTAPISIEYEVVSKPIVGAPVQINVIASSAQGPLMVKYSINDASALRFQEGQVQADLVRAPGDRMNLQQAVRREGFQGVVFAGGLAAFV